MSPLRREIRNNVRRPPGLTVWITAGWALLVSGLLAPQACGMTPDAAPYLLAPGDVIEITVSSHAGYDRTATIGPDGRIQFPLAGDVAAAGLTLVQLANRLREGLNSELIDPQVTVSLKELNKGPKPSVTVWGAVRNPGVFELAMKRTLAEALAMAGGPLASADLSRITITRADRIHALTVDLSRVAMAGQAGADPAIEAGDLIVVPAGQAPMVLVTGEVGRPGSYPLEGESRVVDAITQAGGPSPRADLSRVKLARGGQTQLLDLTTLVSGRDAPHSLTNVSLRAGDTILVPEDVNCVIVIGEVARPETYRLTGDERVFDVVTRAGGPTREADLTRIALIRRGPDGEPSAQFLNLTRVLKKSEPKQDMTLRAGDVVLVPSRRSSRSSPLETLLLPFASLLNLLR